MPKKFHALLLGVALLTNLLSFVGVSQALTVSPVKIELMGDPGQTLTADFRLLNEQDKELTFYASAENFEAQGETGTPNFTNGDTDLASWIQLLPPAEGVDANSITLKPQEEATRQMTVTIPEDASPGGHFSALFWSTTPPNQEGGVAVGAKVGILVFLSVGGDFETGGDLLSFNTKDEQSFFDQLPVGFEYRFQNSGADRVVPQGNIEIQNVLGWTSDVISINAGQNNVLPLSVRKFEEQWGTPQGSEEEQGFWSKVGSQWDHFALGKYSATLTLTYGPDNTTSMDTVTLWVFPWQILLVGTLSLVTAVVVGTWSLRRYNKMIIQAAMGASKGKPATKTQNKLKGSKKKK